MPSSLKSFFLFLLASFIFMIFALYNGFPLVMGDTAAYLDSGYKLSAFAERPIFYGLFVRFTSLEMSVWLAIWVQCMLLAHLLIRLVRFLVPQIPALHLIGILLVISLGTISSWYAGQLSPDALTPILALAVFNFLFLNNSKAQKAFLIVLIFYATVVHFSHYLLLTLLTVSLLAFVFIVKKYRTGYLLKSLVLLVVSVAAWLGLMSSNYLTGNGFVTSKASPVFLMGKLSESGILKMYLEKACPTKNYAICQYKYGLPPVAWDFVWDDRFYIKSDSVNAVASQKEYKTILGDICSRPKYLGLMAYKSIEATARQVILTNIDEGEERAGTKYEENHQLFKQMGKHFPHEINQFVSSRQNKGTLNYSFYDEVYVIVLLLSTLFVLFGIDPKTREKAFPVYLFFLCFILLNAFATATFANVLSRLNSRAIWLFPMLNIVFVYLFCIKKQK